MEVNPAVQRAVLRCCYEGKRHSFVSSAGKTIRLYPTKDFVYQVQAVVQVVNVVLDEC